MKIEIKEKTIKVVSVTGAALVMIFGCFAPIIFTRKGACFDFTHTGEIGDTIGGVMGPFIAIAGVLMTFAAFYMQVKANEIQREQFKETLLQTYINEQLENWNALQLLYIDICFAIEDLESRLAAINSYLEEIDRDPFVAIALQRTPLISVDRYTQVDRNKLYSAVVNFVESENPELFIRDIYRNLDMYNAGVVSIYEVIYDPSITDIQAQKELVPSLFEQFVKNLQVPKSYDSNSLLVYILFLQEEASHLYKDGILDLRKLHTYLKDNEITHSIELQLLHDKMYGTLQRISTQTRMMSEALKDGEHRLRESVLPHLITIRNLIKEALDNNTRQQIRESFPDTHILEK